MTARDRFERNLKCPVCGREGVAKLSEEDGYSYAFGDQSTRVDFLPEGFKAVKRPSSIGKVDFECVDHPGSAV